MGSVMLVSLLLNKVQITLPSITLFMSLLRYLKISRKIRFKDMKVDEEDFVKTEPSDTNVIDENVAEKKAIFRNNIITLDNCISIDLEDILKEMKIYKTVCETQNNIEELISTSNNADKSRFIFDDIIKNKLPRWF